LVEHGKRLVVIFEVPGTLIRLRLRPNDGFYDWLGVAIVDQVSG
jgi:hypothetical protein